MVHLKCGVEDLSTIQQVKSHQDIVLKKCGVSPRMVKVNLVLVCSE